MPHQHPQRNADATSPTTDETCDTSRVNIRRQLIPPTSHCVRWHIHIPPAHPHPPSHCVRWHILIPRYHIIIPYEMPLTAHSLPCPHQQPRPCLQPAASASCLLPRCSQQTPETNMRETSEQGTVGALASQSIARGTPRTPCSSLSLSLAVLSRRFLSPLSLAAFSRRPLSPPSLSPVSLFRSLSLTHSLHSTVLFLARVI